MIQYTNYINIVGWLFVSTGSQERSFVILSSVFRKILKKDGVYGSPD
jgi:hypothetical protein